MRGSYTSRLSKKQSYLQIALNSTLSDAASVIDALPASDRILIEAGTPLIKRYGAQGIRQLREWWEYKLQGFPLGASMQELQQLQQQRAFQQGVKQLFGKKIAGAIANRVSDVKLPYVVADLKTMDRGATEAEIAASAGASGAIALGSAPKETLDTFIASCHANGIDAMIDMMNVEYPLAVLTALKVQPDVVVLHRGVDEERDNRQKMLPLHEIRRIKGRYDILIAVAGGDTPREVQSAAFNDADIVVVWKSVYQKTSETSALVDGFLKTIK